MKVNLNIDDNLIEEFETALNIKTANNIARMAFVILKWVVDEIGKDREIYSINIDRSDKKKLVLPWVTKNGSIGTEVENRTNKFNVNIYTHICKEVVIVVITDESTGGYDMISYVEHDESNINESIISNISSNVPMIQSTIISEGGFNFNGVPIEIVKCSGPVKIGCGIYSLIRGLIDDPFSR
jgi:hypothetical protein